MVAAKKINFRDMLLHAKRNWYAVGAFNVFNYTSAQAVLNSGEALRAPLIIQTSTATVRKFTPERLIGMLNEQCRNSTVPVCIHLDHCTDIAMAKACMDCGWDSVMIDLSRLPLNENIEGTNAIIAYAKKLGICVESELGIISGVEDDISSDTEQQPGLEEALDYIKAVEIDAFAPAIGTSHGVYKKAAELNYDLVLSLSKETDVPVVVHGGTGLSSEQFAKLIRCGSSKINVSTALKTAYIQAVADFAETRPGSGNPLELDAFVLDALQAVVEEHIRMFSAYRKIN